MHTTTSRLVECVAVVTVSVLLMVFVSSMHRGQYGPWLWMLFPVFLLTGNLVWPRSRRLKSIGLVILVLAAWLPDLNPLDRVVGLAERILIGGQEGTPEQIVSNLRLVQGWAHQTLFYVSIGFTLAVIFAVTPVDLISRFRSQKAEKHE